MIKRYIFIFILFLLLDVTLYSQITTTIFPNGNAFEEFPFLNQINKEEIPLYEMSSFNLDSIIQEENYYREAGGYPFRFGYAIDVDYRIEHGKWFEAEYDNVWLIRFKSKGAYTLNFGFSELQLAPNANLYIYNSDGTVIYGPVTYEENSINEFSSIGTDLISGEETIIQITEPKVSIYTSALKITTIVHGFENYYKDILPSNNKNNDNLQAADLNCHIGVLDRC